MEQKGEGRKRMCVRHRDYSQLVTSNHQVQRGSPRPSPPLALFLVLFVVMLCCLHALAPSPDIQLFPAAGAQETQVDRCRQLLYSLPTSVYLLPLFGMGPRPLLGMMSHTEGSKGSSDAGNQAGRRGYEAPERKESAGPGIWGGGRLLLGLTPSS